MRGQGGWVERPYNEKRGKSLKGLGKDFIVKGVVEGAHL